MYDYADVFEVVRYEPKDFRQAGPAGGGSSTPSRLKAAGVRRVVIVPDADEDGRAHGQAVARACADGARRPDLPGGTPAGLVADDSSEPSDREIADESLAQVLPPPDGRPCQVPSLDS